MQEDREESQFADTPDLTHSQMGGRNSSLEKGGSEP